MAEADGTGGSKIRAMGNIYKAKSLAAEKSEQDYQLVYSEIKPMLDIQLTKLDEIDQKKKDETATLSRASPPALLQG